MIWPSHMPGAEDRTDIAFLPVHFFLLLLLSLSPQDRQDFSVPASPLSQHCQQGSGAVTVYVQTVIALSVSGEVALLHCWLLVPLLQFLAVF